MVEKRKNKSRKLNAVIQLILVLGLIVVLNVLGQFMFTRFDLTEDKRFTLGKPTIQTLEQLEETIYVEVYLEGKDLQPGFKQLRDATKEMLDEFRQASGQHIEYSFIDPYEQAKGADRNAYFQILSNQGLKSFEVNGIRNDELTRKIIWPSALVKLGEKSVPVSLLMNQNGRPAAEILHNSVMRVEYELVAAIQRLKQKYKPRIAIVAGHGELASETIADVSAELKINYDVERMGLPSYKPGKLEQYDCAIVAKPDSAFSDVDLYKLDQYIMHGGKVLWLVDPLHADMDSLRKLPYWTVSDKYDLKSLRGLLYNYGARLNENFIQDYNSHTIPIALDGQGSIKNGRKWPFYPIVIPESNHPITKGVGRIWTQFASTIDTVNKPGIKKIPLLKTSANSKVLPHPVRIDISITRFDFQPSEFNMHEQTVAMLLEGKFTSDFKNRLQPETLNNEDFANFKADGEATKMIVISDGDLMSNQVAVDPKTGQKRIFTAGYDRFSQQYFDNKSFILNCVDYLVDDSGIFSLRSKDLTLRMLDKAKAKEEGQYWTWFNLLLPLSLLVVFGLIFNFIRKRRYTA